MLREVDNFRDIAERKARDGVGASVVDGHASRRGVVQRSARERNVRNVAHAFVRFARGDQVGTAAGRDLPRLLQIQQCRAEGVDIAVA